MVIGTDLKLFVVGESSGDPELWSQWGGFALVLANTPQEAIQLTGDLTRPEATEVVFDKPKLLHYQDIIPSSI